MNPSRSPGAALTTTRNFPFQLDLALANLLRARAAIDSAAVTAPDTERFEVLREVGRGGFGVVFQARDRVDGSTVAVKVLHVSNDLADARFDREALLLSQLRHPSIVRYIAHGRTPAGRFLAMEWLEGFTLQHLLKTVRPSVSDVVVLARRMLEALAEASRFGVVHRDIKPANVFLDRFDRRARGMAFDHEQRRHQLRGRQVCLRHHGSNACRAPQPASAVNAHHCLTLTWNSARIASAPQAIKSAAARLPTSSGCDPTCVDRTGGNDRRLNAALLR